MNVCQACKRQCELYLCTDCTNTLADMLSQLPFLIAELDTRIQKLDRIGQGTIGRNRRPDELNVIDFDAAEAARTLRKDLLRWVERIAQQHTGRTPPILDTVATADLARWLQANVHAIAKLHLAGSLFHDIETKVGQDQRGGQLVKAINRQPERHFAGPCPTVRGHNGRGEEMQCGTELFADEGARTVNCPKCKHPINVEKNRERTAKARDLHTKPDLLEILDNIGESVTSAQLDRWIRARRLRRSGWLHEGRLVPHRIRNSDPPVYSVARARKIRARDHQLRTKTQETAAQ